MHLHALTLLILLLPFSVLRAADSTDSTSAEQTPLERALSLFQARQFAEARPILEKLAQAEPNQSEAAYYLGKIALEQKDEAQAISWLEKATALSPNQSTYYNALGNAYGLAAKKAGLLSKLGLAKKCIAAWDKAIALDPDNL